MKRAFKKKSKATMETSSGEDVPVEHPNKIVTNLSHHRMPSKAAMIALAISMGATSPLVNRQNDQALAGKPVDSQKADAKTAAPDTKVNFSTTKSLESQATSSTSVPTNPAIVEPTAISQEPGLGAKLQATVGISAVVNTVGVDNSISLGTKNQPVKSANVSQESKNSFEASNEQLKAQQEFALNRLQEKSNRLKTGLAELRSEETKTVSTNLQNPAVSANQANLVSRLRKAITKANATDKKTVVNAQPNFVIHEVKSGDTLAVIAQKYNISVSDIVTNNTLSNPYQLKTNQKLNIPVSDNIDNQESSQTNYTGIGGDVPVPTAVAEMRVADIRVSQAKNLKNNPRLNSLRKEIERLRAKYRAQQSGNQFRTEGNNRETVVESNVSSGNKTGVPIFVPQPMTSVNNSRPIRPRFFPSRFRNNGVRPNRGISDTESLGNLRRVKVSPKTKALPPLAAVDRYLPRPIDEIPKSSSTYIWPAKGTLTSGYGPRWGRMHRGIDIANSTGTPIYAAGDGVVTSAGWSRGGYGKLVKIRHANGSETRYAHNSKILVKVGQKVQQGKTIALMGSTGFSTGPHLHFEIRPAGKGAVNPIALLPERL